jgi:hypothetical protein
MVIIEKNVHWFTCPTIFWGAKQAVGPLPLHNSFVNLSSSLYTRHLDSIGKLLRSSPLNHSAAVKSNTSPKRKLSGFSLPQYQAVNIRLVAPNKFKTQHDGVVSNPR